MMETIKELFAASPVMAWSIVSVLVAMAVMATLWNKLAWWWLNTWMSFPLIGRISRLSKDLNRDSADNKWFKAEKALSRDYKKFIRIQDEHDFNEKVDYITKAGDNGRNATPTWIFLLTAMLVFVEAMGFSYVLAGWTIPGASETTQQYGALGIAFLISVILFAFTHYAGHELYVSNKIKHARREWAEDGRKQKFTTGTIALASKHGQHVDDAQSSYTQLANRVGTHESYMVTMATIVIVVIVAAGATYVRGQVLEKTLHQSVVGSQHQAEFELSFNDDGLNMAVKGSDNPALPETDLAQNQAVKDKALMDEVSIDRHGGWGTFIILAFIFVFLQILGGLFGYKWGFAGRDSKAAFKAIGSGRYSSYSDVRERYTEVADAAQAKLEALQQKLMERNAEIGTEGMHTQNTFRDFMKIARQEEANDRKNQVEHTTKTAKQENSTAVEEESVATPLTITQALQQLESLQDKDDKRAYIKSLPASMQAEIKNALMLAKAEAEKVSAAQTQLDDELDKLL